MAAFFTSANSSYFASGGDSVYLPATLAGPVMMACWLRPTAHLQDAMSLGGTNNSLSIGHTAAMIPQITTRDGGVNNLANSGVAMVAGTWNFMIGRFISTSQHRLTTLHAGGAISQASETTATGTGALNASAVGCQYFTTSGPARFFDGSIGEAWFGEDIGVNSAVGNVIPNELLYQLAFGGPFSVPSIASGIWAYLSLRDWMPPVQWGAPLNGTYSKAPSGLKPVYTAAGAAAPTLTDHPPLPYWFGRPEEGDNIMLV